MDRSFLDKLVTTVTETVEEEIGDRLIWEGDQAFSEEDFFFEGDQELEKPKEVLDLAMKRVAREIEAAIDLYPSEWTELMVQMPVDGKVEPFSMVGRGYLRSIYDLQARRILLVFGRQCEKTVSTKSLISMSDGSLRLAGDVRLGDRVASCDVDSLRSGDGEVTWVSEIYKKPGVRITTRQGHVVEVGHEHPMRKLLGWCKAEDLVVGDRLAVVRKAGLFGEGVSLRDEEIELAAMFLGDGYLKGGSLTGVPGPLMDRARECLDVLGWSFGVSTKKDNKAVAIRIHKKYRPLLWSLCESSEDTSSSKKLPSWTSQMDARQSSLFLNRLWSTDGCVRVVGTKWNLVYTSVSKELSRGVQSLLWKFGIPSRIRENFPSYWKKRGVKKPAYLLRIETGDGVRRFLGEIGALAKS